MTDLKDLYFSQFTDRQLSAYQSYQIRKALSKIRASAKYQNMPKIAVFINGKKEVFTHDELRLLSRPFSGAAAGERFCCGTLSELMGLPDEDAGKFRETGFVCMVPYSYSGEDAKGTIAAVYDAARFQHNVEELLGSEDYSLILLQNGVPFYRIGKETGSTFSADAASIAGLSIELILPQKDLWAKILPAIAPSLGAAFLLSAAFLALAYFFSTKYYAPIGEIGALIATGQQAAEAEDIVSGVKSWANATTTARKSSPSAPMPSSASCAIS